MTDDSDFKYLITCAFIIDGFFDIETREKINSEIEDVIFKHMREQEFTTCERTFNSDQVIQMIKEANR